MESFDLNLIWALPLAIVVFGVLAVIIITAIVVICMSLCALVKPHISDLMNKWLDWFYERIDE